QVEATGAVERFAGMYFAQEGASLVRDRALVQACGLEYAAKLAKVARGVGTRRSELAGKIENFIASSKNQGWFGLGAHYWTYATLEQELQQACAVPVGWLAPNYRAFAEVLPASFATVFWPRLQQVSHMGDDSSDNLWDKIKSALNPLTALTRRFAMYLECQPDALLAMVRLSRWLSSTCEGILLGAEAAKLAALGGSKLLTKNVASRIADFFTGGGEAADTVAKALIDDLFFFLRIIILPLWAYATFVAYVVPAMPFLIWLAALAGWVLMVLEMLIAAPFWLIGHGMSEGEGFSGQWGKNGYFLWFSIFLRPALLVLSMFVCFMVMQATGHVLGALAAPFIESQAEIGAVGLGIVGGIFMFLILSAALALLTYTLFSFVTKIPDRIMRWLWQGSVLGNEAVHVLSNTVFTGAINKARMLAQAGVGAVKHDLGLLAQKMKKAESGFLAAKDVEKH
ncbi:MAG: DotA/TraY family protein, partial [Desulfovibrio sp.]|nr:DotA/TraY family protein [Desulfovibrio sp.]